MSIRVIKKGLLDTIQDRGRYGYQHLGINPGGAMDRVAASVANMNKQTVPLNTAIVVSKNAVLEFTGYKNGARCYLAVYGGWKAGKWLNSYSTNLKAAAGGYNGRALQKDDVLFFNKEQHLRKPAPSNAFSITNILADIDVLYGSEKITCLTGAFYEHLTDDTKKIFSSAVTRGTIQLLPSGQLIILMADHQTTGGYPVIAHVISSDVPALAQKRPQETVQFQIIRHAEAELRLMHQYKQIQIQQQKLAGKFKEAEILSGCNSLSS